MNELVDWYLNAPWEQALAFTVVVLIGLVILFNIGD